MEIDKEISKKERENKEAKDVWGEVANAQRFHHAFRGLGVFFQSTRHIVIHISAAFLAVILGFYFKVSNWEWIALVFAIGLVFISEAINTAIEIDIDLTSPEYHPYARDTKDVAAAAVLLAVCTALTVGLIIFLPKVF